MSMVASAIAVGVGSIITAGTSLYNGYQQSQAIQKASDQQSASDQAAIAEQQRQFNTIQGLLAPYVQTGQQALTGQGDLTGLNGADAQQAAITALQNSPQYQATTQAGQRSILSSAAATGGLRGGNVQAALGQFGTQNLSNLINNQFTRLGGLTNLGQNAAAGTGAAAQATGNQVSNLLTTQGNQQAGATLGASSVQSQTINQLLQSLGQAGSVLF